MNTQDFHHHSRSIPLWHFIMPVLMFSALVGSIINLFNAAPGNIYSAALIVLIVVMLVIIYWYARWFALRAQDRAIRAEEKLRHYILTGRPLDNRLRLSQIIALRFAPDDEFVELAERAVIEKLDAKAIKQAIKNWKPDYNRV